MKKMSLKRTGLLLLLASALIAGMLALVGCHKGGSAENAANSNGHATAVTSETQVTVPNVVSLTQADAEKSLNASGLRLGTVTQKPSNTVPRGNVISQDPAALTTAPGGTAVNIVVSSGKGAPTYVNVPDVRGMSEADAKKALADVGLVGVATAPEESSAVKPGQVFKQSIDPGKSVPEGTRVSYTVALAPTEVVVPDVTGKSKDDAKKALVDAGLSFDFTVAYDDTVPEGQVISQSIAAGKKVNAGTTVSVVVSLGKKPVDNVKVPDVTSYSWSDAEKALESAGLVAHYTGDPSGVVTAQDVAAGTMVAPNTIVTVTLTVPIQTVAVPDLSNMTLSEAETATDNLGLALDYSGDPNGVITSQSPDAGTTVDVGTTVNVTLEVPAPAPNPDDQGAGEGSDEGTSDGSGEDSDEGTGEDSEGGSGEGTDTTPPDEGSGSGDTPEPAPAIDWQAAGSAGEAAANAGVTSFNVPDWLPIENVSWDSVAYRWAPNMVQADYTSSMGRVTVRKGQNVTQRDLVSDYTTVYNYSWTSTVGDTDIVCAGDQEGVAEVLTWSSGDDQYAIWCTGLGITESNLEPVIQSIG